MKGYLIRVGYTSLLGLTEGYLCRVSVRTHCRVSVPVHPLDPLLPARKFIMQLQSPFIFIIIQSNIKNHPIFCSMKPSFTIKLFLTGTSKTYTGWFVYCSSPKSSKCQPVKKFWHFFGDIFYIIWRLELLGEDIHSLELLHCHHYCPHPCQPVCKCSKLPPLPLPQLLHKLHPEGWEETLPVGRKHFHKLVYICNEVIGR